MNYKPKVKFELILLAEFNGRNLGRWWDEAGGRRPSLSLKSPEAPELWEGVRPGLGVTPWPGSCMFVPY
jgi:hypothetical protein